MIYHAATFTQEILLNSQTRSQDYKKLMALSSGFITGCVFLQVNILTFRIQAASQLLHPRPAQCDISFTATVPAVVCAEAAVTDYCSTASAGSGHVTGRASMFELYCKQTERVGATNHLPPPAVLSSTHPSLPSPLHLLFASHSFIHLQQLIFRPSLCYHTE